jgi:hypothetical protein
VDVESGGEPGRSRVSALGRLAAACLGNILIGARVFPWRVCPTYLLFGVNCPLCGLTSGCSEAWASGAGPYAALGLGSNHGYGPGDQL